MGEKVSLDSDQLLLIVTQAEVTGFVKAVAALRKKELTERRLIYLENATYSDWLENNKDEILKGTK